MTLFAITGLAVLPGVRDSARYARHSALHLALLRDSSGAARALAEAQRHAPGDAELALAAEGGKA